MAINRAVCRLRRGGAKGSTCLDAAACVAHRRGHTAVPARQRSWHSRELGRVRSGGSEFLTEFTISIPANTPAETVDDTEKAEAERAYQLAEQGNLLRLWKLPAETDGTRVLGLWRGQNAAGMEAILRTLPLDVWMTVDITPLTPHPSDPALSKT